MRRIVFAVLTVFTLLSAVASGADYYVDSRTGSDDASGNSPQTAWKSLKRANRATEIQPGDKILLARGGVWRETLTPHSGEEGKPILYGAYGEGALPRLLGSVDASDPDYWSEVQPGIWATKKIEMVPDHSAAFGFDAPNAWFRHQENGAESDFKPTKRGFSVEGKKSGTAWNHLQIWGPVLPRPIDGSTLGLKMRARGSKEFSLPAPGVIESGSPYASRFSGGAAQKIGDQWQEFTVFLSEVGGEESKELRLHWNLGLMPADTTLELEILDAGYYRRNDDRILFCDAGNLIFDHGDYKKGHRCGVKKWGLDQIKEQGDFWYNPEDKRVYLRWNGNPMNDLTSLEIALNSTIVNQGGCHDVVYENLALAYGAAHGFGGGNTNRIVIRRCDLYYIGGGHQFTRPDGHPVRFGNAIEFWGSCDDCLVEENRIWEVYDAALTNQGRGNPPQNRSIEKNVVYRNNVIWNSEYSFEYWNNDETENILFEGNICWNAGFGWAHGQRPDPNGGHLMFYTNSAKTKNFVIRNNVFSESTEVCLRMENDWRDGLTLDGNRYFQSEKPLIRWVGKTYFGKDELAKIQDELGFEKNGKMEKFTPPAFEAR